MRELSQLLLDMPGSLTIAVNDKAKVMQAAGLDVISLAGGDPDFDTPAHIIDAGVDAIRSGKTHYPAPTKGIPELMEAIARKTSRENDINVDPKSEILATPGSKWALVIALAAVVNPGDEVLYLEPAWVSYPPIIRLVGGTPVPVALNPDSNFVITHELLESRLSNKTKALMVNSPNNPTGRVLTIEEVDAIVDVAQAADLYVIADEVYEKLIFDQRQHYSLGARPGMPERTLTTSGLSKGYAMTGWRLGWLVGPKEAIKLAGKFHSQTITSAASFTMAAAVAALNGPQDLVAEMRDSYKQRRDFMVNALNEIDGLQCQSPEGAFYLLPRFTKTEKNSLELADALLDQAGIAATPGIAFGSSAEKHLRFSIATAMNELERAVERLNGVVPRL